MAAVVALNVAETVAAGTVTDDGTVRVELVLVSVTMAPPPGAAPVRVTVQVEVLVLFKVAGRQDSDVTVGKTIAPPVTMAPAAESRMACPVGDDAALLLIPITVVVTPAAMVRLTTATVPFEMMPAFIPEATQVYAPKVA